jgi:hypothetical protein
MTEPALSSHALETPSPPNNSVERSPEGVDYESLNKQYFNSIVRNAQVKFRNNLETEPPEDLPDLVDGASDSDEGPRTPRELLPKHAAISAGLRKTTIGGAVVENLAIVIPSDSDGGVGDLPVMLVIAPQQEKSELLAPVWKNAGENSLSSTIPLLLMPPEEGYEEDFKSVSVADGISHLATISSFAIEKATGKDKPKSKESDGTATEGKEGKQGAKPEGDQGTVAKAELDGYILSGDIKNLFGINGLTGKLYKFKGRG